jgi:hypothetical protein
LAYYLTHFSESVLVVPDFHLIINMGAAQYCCFGIHMKDVTLLSKWSQLGQNDILIMTDCREISIGMLVAFYVSEAKTQ